MEGKEEILLLLPHQEYIYFDCEKNHNGRGEGKGGEDGRERV
tara:strand:- start:329 stop:454 length:126 start_codon:yes stop_codon:yes gene_type:complete